MATGTDAYFAELNRQRPPRGATVCYSLNPQVHAFDDLSLVETLAGAQRLLPVSVSDPQRVAALAFEKEDGRSTCLLANLTRRTQELELDLSAPGLGLATIDEAQLPAARAGAPPAWRPLTIHRGMPTLALNPNALVKLELP